MTAKVWGPRNLEPKCNKSTLGVLLPAPHNHTPAQNGKWWQCPAAGRDACSEHSRDRQGNRYRQEGHWRGYLGCCPSPCSVWWDPVSPRSPRQALGAARRRRRQREPAAGRARGGEAAAAGGGGKAHPAGTRGRTAAAWRSSPGCPSWTPRPGTPSEPGAVPQTERPGAVASSAPRLSPAV